MKNKRNYDLSTKINKVFKEKEDLYLLTHLLEILNIYDKKVVLFKEIDETDKYIASSLIKEIFNLNMFKSILKDENKEVVHQPTTKVVGLRSTTS